MKNYIENQFYRPLTPEEGVISIISRWSEAEKKGDRNARQFAASEIKDFLVETADGSFTLYSKKCDNGSETMHTMHGAFFEAKEKFANPANLEGKNEITILDLCSGLGMNAAAALDKVLDFEVNDELEYMGIDLVEVSWETLAVCLLIPSPSESHKIIKKAIENYLIKKSILKFPKEEKKIPDQVDIRVHSKDAREMVMGIPETRIYDAIFLDPFSPSKSPELYSYDFLQKLSSLIKKDGLILTYTAAAPVRYALIDIGLEVGEGPEVGRSGGTIASLDLNKISRDLNDNDERMIALSDAGIPFRDPEFNDSSQKISERRYRQRIDVRGINKMASTVKTPIYLAKKMDDQRTKRRVINHLEKFKIADLNTEMARFLVCPQFPQCLCNCKKGKIEGSRGRVKEMENRLKIIVDANLNDY